MPSGLVLLGRGGAVGMNPQRDLVVAAADLGCRRLAPHSQHLVQVADAEDLATELEQPHGPDGRTETARHPPVTRPLDLDEDEDEDDDGRRAPGVPASHAPYLLPRCFTAIAESVTSQKGGEGSE